VHKRIISPVKRVVFVRDSIPYMILTGRWCHIIVLNVHASTQDKVEDNFYEELELMYDIFLKYYTVWKFY
jgi:hypothetical protein